VIRGVAFNLASFSTAVVTLHLSLTILLVAFLLATMMGVLGGFFPAHRADRVRGQCIEHVAHRVEQSGKLRGVGYAKLRGEQLRRPQDEECVGKVTQAKDTNTNKETFVRPRQRAEAGPKTQLMVYGPTLFLDHEGKSERRAHTRDQGQQKHHTKRPRGICQRS
jgi:hypothetical protein